MSYSVDSKFNSTLQQIIDGRDQATWSDYLAKEYTDSSKLVKLSNSIYKKADWQNNPQVFTLLDKTIQVLSTKKLDPKLVKKVEKLQTKMKNTDKVCFIRGSNTPEVAGLPKKAINNHGADKDKTIHIHAPRLKRQYDKWAKSHSGKDFNEYLEKNASGKEKRMLKKNEVSYLSEEQAEKYRVKFKKGKIQQRGKTIPDGEHIFVLNLKGTRLYAGRKRPGKFHHSSFLAGAPVQCAGELHIKKGKIKKIPLSSGHYKPTKEAGENIRNYLAKDAHLGKAAKKLKIIGHFDK
jgi:hypothetical protein